MVTAMKKLLLFSFLSTLYACSHPLEIVGEGDILSSTGTRNCYLEDFQAGKESCTVNLVVLDYQETYYAVPRDGWEFEQWLNYSHCANTGNACAFNLPAAAVKTGWRQTVAPLVAVFAKTAPPPPEPVAMYSYQLDAAGDLLNPQPLEGAHLERKVAYFTYTGDFIGANFWCCKVPDGDEAHGEKVEDRTPPFVLRIDLNALPDDAGLQREFYADLFTSATSYTGHSAYWTLARPVVGPVVFNDGGSHIIDYDISTGIRVEDSTSVTIAPGVTISGPEDVVVELRFGSLITVDGAYVDGEILSEYGSNVILHDGSIGRVNADFDSYGLTMTGGTINDLYFMSAIAELNISGGHISTVYIYDGTAKISGGVIGDFTGGWDFQMQMTGGRIEDRFLLGPRSSGHIRGGTILPLMEIEYESQLTFYGNVTLTDPVAIDARIGTIKVLGVLEDGTPIEGVVECDLDFTATLGPCYSVSVVQP